MPGFFGWVPAGFPDLPPVVLPKSPRPIIPAYLGVILNDASQSLVNMQGFASWPIMVFDFSDFAILVPSLYYFLVCLGGLLGL